MKDKLQLVALRVAGAFFCLAWFAVPEAKAEVCAQNGNRNVFSFRQKVDIGQTRVEIKVIEKTSNIYPARLATGEGVYLYDEKIFIDWGDGTTIEIPSAPCYPRASDGPVAAGTPHTWPLSTFSRQYAKPGDYQVRIYLTGREEVVELVRGPVVFERDTDGDRIIDHDDACPTQAGPVSNRGCPLPPDPDTDNDGVRGTSDACPVEPGPASKKGCPLTRRFEVTYMAFIPANYSSIPSPEATCLAKVGSIVAPIPLIFEADNRSFDFSAYNRGRYRAAVRTIILEKKDHTGKSSYEVLPSKNSAYITESVSFVANTYGARHRGALDNGTRGRIDAKDYDKSLRDCDLLYDRGRGRLGGLWNPYIVSSNAAGVTIRFRGNAVVGLLAVAPPVDWDVTLKISSGNRVTAQASGHLDEFPAHEIYVNGTPVHCYSPNSPRHPFPCGSPVERSRLPVITHDWLMVGIGLKTHTPFTGNRSSIPAPAFQ